jgi:hypothetical protein
VEGKYQSIIANPTGKMWSAQLLLFLGVYQDQLRFFAAPEELIPTPEELADSECQKRLELTDKLRRSLSVEQLQSLGIEL